MTDDQLREHIRAARKIAAPVGPMHSYWDLIFDAEAILDGRPSLLPRDAIEQVFLEIDAARGSSMASGRPPIEFI